MPNLNSQQIDYHLTLVSAEQHLFGVELRVNLSQLTEKMLYLPAWIPGSYMIRDFAKNIQGLTALDSSGQVIPLEKIDKQSWKLPKNTTEVTVKYQVYAFDLSVRSAFFDSEFAFFNGTSMFLAIAGMEQCPTSLHIDFNDPQLASNWQLATTLPQVSNQQYQAENYEQLIDCPTLIGELEQIEFHCSGVQFELVFAGLGNMQLHKSRLIKDLTAICEHHIAMFGNDCPVQRYQFQTMVTDNGFGGLEHMDSTALMCSRSDLPVINQGEEMTDGYRTFLSLCSHELFHTWHVKRIKPRVLCNADLTQEQYTEQLWIYEGFTSYYDELALVRAGVISQTSYLELLAQALTRLQRNQGRLQQTVTESSWYAWNKFYKQDENAINSIVSYYNKGAIIALCLDLMLMQKTDNRYRLDDIMRQLWQNFGKIGQGTNDDVIHNLLKQQNIQIEPFLGSALYTCDELPFEELLNQQGITVCSRPRSQVSDKGGKPSSQNLKNEFGAQFTAMETGVKITQVVNASAASQAGLSVGDQLLAIAGHKITQSNLSTVLDSYSPGTDIELTIFRRGLLKSLSLEVQAASSDTIWLEIKQQQQVDQWLTLRHQ